MAFDREALAAQALAEEAQARDLAFLADIPEPLCGTPVFALDLRNLVLLTHCGNRFIVGGPADTDDIRQLLWLQSPLYVAGDASAKQQFVNSLPEVDEAAAVAEVRAWIDATFYDAPPGRSRPAGAEGVILDEPIASFVASWIDLLGSEYGWGREQIVGSATRRGISLRELFQLYRCCVRRRDPKHPFSSTAIVRLDAQWLSEPDGAGEKAAAPQTFDSIPSA